MYMYFNSYVQRNYVQMTCSLSFLTTKQPTKQYCYPQGRNLNYSYFQFYLNVPTCKCPFTRHLAFLLVSNVSVKFRMASKENVRNGCKPILCVSATIGSVFTLLNLIYTSWSDHNQHGGFAFFNNSSLQKDTF